jgi:hypothetical protein
LRLNTLPRGRLDGVDVRLQREAGNRCRCADSVQHVRLWHRSAGAHVDVNMRNLFVRCRIRQEVAMALRWQLILVATADRRVVNETDIISDHSPYEEFAAYEP